VFSGRQELQESFDYDSDVTGEFQTFTCVCSQRHVVVEECVQLFSDFLWEYVAHLGNHDQLQAFLLAHFAANAILESFD